MPQWRYEDSERRSWKVNALECTETTARAGRHYFAWLTDAAGQGKTVEEVAQKGGRVSLEDRE